MILPEPVNLNLFLALAFCFHFRHFSIYCIVITSFLGWSLLSFFRLLLLLNDARLADVGIIVYFLITLTLIGNIFIIFKVVRKYKFESHNLIYIPMCVLIMVGFSIVVIRSLILNSYFAGGEPYAYISCILFGLIYKIDFQRRPIYLWLIIK